VAFLHLIGFLAEMSLLVFIMLGAFYSGGWWIAALVAYAIVGMLVGTRWIVVVTIAFVVALLIHG